MADTPGVNDAPTVGLEGVLVDQMQIHASDGSLISSYVHAEYFTLAAPTALSGITIALSDVYRPVNGAIDDFSGTLSYAIYTNAGGVPGTLLTSGTATSVELAYFGSGTYGDYASATIDLGGYALAPGNYWIAVHEGAWGSATDGS